MDIFWSRFPGFHQILKGVHDHVNVKKYYFGILFKKHLLGASSLPGTSWMGLQKLSLAPSSAFWP